MLAEVIRYLECPYCGAGMVDAGAALRCGRGHAFDIARQGYVSLLPAGAKGGGGDTVAMVRARGDFLAAGHFAGLAADLAQAAADVAASPAVPGCVLDVGAGTGYYLAAVLGRLPGRAGLALDVSRPALRWAARVHPRIGAVACDAWLQLPVADSAAILALNVFAPRNGAELRRVLSPAGRPAHRRPAQGRAAQRDAEPLFRAGRPDRASRGDLARSPGDRRACRDGADCLACGLSRACRAHPAAARPGGRHACGDGICLPAD